MSDEDERMQVEIEAEELAEAQAERRRPGQPRPLITPEMDDETEPLMKKIAYLAFLYGTHPDHQKNGSERGIDERRKASFESWWKIYTRGLR